MRQHFILAFLVGTLLSACTTSKSSIPLSESQSSEKSVLREAYFHIRKHYLNEPPSPTRLATSAMTAIQAKTGAPGSKPIGDDNITDEQALEVLNTAIARYSVSSGLPKEDLEHTAITGMVRELDPLSTFFPPKLYAELQRADKERPASAGIYLKVKDKRLLVFASIADSPADRAGIRAGDQLTHIDNESTKDLSLPESIHRLRGPAGTRVVLTISRDRESQPIQLLLEREILKADATQSKIVSDAFGYIKPGRIQQSSVEDLKSALTKFRDASVKGIILDLRNNEGGDIPAVIHTADLFFPTTATAFVLRTRDGGNDKYWAQNKTVLVGVPITVLVNGVTSAGAEILAGALQDNHIATVIGMTTSGSGTVQTFIPLTDKSMLRLTTARVYRPNGRPIDDGIQPDIVVEDKDGFDVTQEAAFNHLKTLMK